MIAAALSFLFPVKPTGSVPHGSVTLQLIRDGKIATVQQDLDGGGPVNVKVWNGGRWETIKEFRNEKPLASHKTFTTPYRVLGLGTPELRYS